MKNMLQKKMILLLGAFAKLRKASISCVTSVYLFVRPSARMEQLVSHRTDVHENLIFEDFSKTCREKLKFH